MSAPPIAERHLHHFHRRSPIKEACRVATTASITISTGLNVGDTIDGVTLADGDRVLVKDQGTASQNGIYLAGATPARDYDVSTDDPAFGFLVYVREGTTNGGTLWSNTNTTAPTIGSTSLTFSAFTSGSSSLPLYFVDDYGAVGDDSTNDATAIQAAIDAAGAAGGGLVLFGAKTYKITATLSTSDPHIQLVGVGNEYGPSVIHMTTSNTTAISFPSSWSDTSRTFQGSMRDLLVKGPGSASSGAGIYAKSNINLDNVGVEGFYDGIYWDNVSYYSRARGCFVTDCDRAGMYLTGTNNITIDTCRITGDGSGGVPSLDPVVTGIQIVSALPYGETIRIVNSSVEYFSGDGIYVDGAAALLIDGCYFETQQSSTGHAYINLGPGGSNAVAPAVIRACHFDGPGISGFQAIKTDRASYITIEGNEDTASFGALTVLISSTANGSRFLLLNNKFGSGTITLPANSYTLDPASPPASAPTFAAPSFTLSTSAATGAASTLVRSDATIAAFDATVPVTQAFGDSAAAGSAGVAARRDHIHGMPATPTSGGSLLIADSHSTPLVFGDLLQTEAGDDLLYSG